MKVKLLFKGPVSIGYTEKVTWRNYLDPIFSKTIEYKIKQFKTIMNSESKSYKYVLDEYDNMFLPIIENKKLTLYINYKKKVIFNNIKLENILFELKIIKTNIM